MSKRSENSQIQQFVVVGAGQIGTPLVARLARAGEPVTWVSRTRPQHVPQGVNHVCLDVRDGAALGRVAAGARALIAAVNPAIYDAQVWAETLPPLHQGLIDGAVAANTRLVLLDGLYLYTIKEGPLTPDTRVDAETEKGKIRMGIAALYSRAREERGLRVSTLRASDFWGPELNQALLTHDGLLGLKRGKRPLLVGDPDAPHAFSHRDDVVEALVALALAEPDVEGKVFHAPVIHVSQRELVQAFAEAFGVRARPFVAPRWLLRVTGLFVKSVGGIVEMLPQWQAPYLVDDSSFTGRFGTRATSLEEGTQRIARAA